MRHAAHDKRCDERDRRDHEGSDRTLVVMTRTPRVWSTPRNETWEVRRRDRHVDDADGDKYDTNHYENCNRYQSRT